MINLISIVKLVVNVNCFKNHTDLQMEHNEFEYGFLSSRMKIFVILENR